MKNDKVNNQATGQAKEKPDNVWTAFIEGLKNALEEENLWKVGAGGLAGGILATAATGGNIAAFPAGVVAGAGLTARQLYINKLSQQQNFQPNGFKAKLAREVEYNDTELT